MLRNRLLRPLPASPPERAATAIEHELVRPGVVAGPSHVVLVVMVFFRQSVESGLSPRNPKAGSNGNGQRGTTQPKGQDARARRIPTASAAFRSAPPSPDGLGGGHKLLLQLADLGLEPSSRSPCRAHVGLGCARTQSTASARRGRRGRRRNQPHHGTAPEHGISRHPFDERVSSRFDHDPAHVRGRRNKLLVTGH
jgi:hypothetical protein